MSQSLSLHFPAALVAATQGGMRRTLRSLDLERRTTASSSGKYMRSTLTLPSTVLASSTCDVCSCRCCARRGCSCLRSRRACQGPHRRLHSDLNAPEGAIGSGTAECAKEALECSTKGAKATAGHPVLGSHLVHLAVPGPSVEVFEMEQKDVVPNLSSTSTRPMRRRVSHGTEAQHDHCLMGNGDLLRT
eukprot:3226268-Rhodomonas_salina.2